MNEIIKYNLYKNKENIIIENKISKYTENDLLYFENSILNFNNKKKLLHMYKKFENNIIKKKYELFSEKKIITFVIFNINNSDTLFLNLINLNNFQYNNFEVFIIDFSNELYKPLFLNNISFNYPIKIIYNETNYNKYIFNSNGDILIILKSNSYFANNIMDYINNNFEYNSFYNYTSINLKNIEENNKFIKDKYSIKNKYEIKTQNGYCFVISKNYFKILNGFNKNYDIKFDFIFKDFFSRANIYLNTVNIDNNIINFYIDNDYNNINNKITNDTENNALKCLYEVNNSLYKNISINKSNSILKKIYFLNKIIKNNILPEDKKYTKYKNYINNHKHIKNILSNEEKHIIFFDIKNTTPNFNYYMTNMKRYYNVLNTKYNTSYRNLVLDYTNNFNKNNITEYLHFNNNDIFMIDDLSLTILITSHFNIKNIRKDIEYFINNAKYIICFSEIFLSHDLQMTGCAINNKEFTKLVFKNSIINLILNTKNIYYLYENNINNHIYYPSYGYSVMNNICYNNKDLIYDKNIDLLFYGNYIDNNGKITSKYRYDIIENIKKYSEKNNIIFKSYSNLYEEKDEILKKTKIVIHISPTKNFHVFSWAKAVELMSKKIFFIIEENEEFYIQKLNEIIPYYKKNDLQDLYEKINHYLKNEDIRNKHIELCYNYIKNNYNMDEFLLDLLYNI